MRARARPPANTRTCRATLASPDRGVTRDHDPLISKRCDSMCLRALWLRDGWNCYLFRGSSVFDPRRGATLRHVAPRRMSQGCRRDVAPCGTSSARQRGLNPWHDWHEHRMSKSDGTHSRATIPGMLARASALGSARSNRGTIARSVTRWFGPPIPRHCHCQCRVTRRAHPLCVRCHAR